MKAKINGENADIAAGVTLQELLLGLKLNPKVTVVEKNGEIISMADYEKEIVMEGDELELIRYVGGG